MPFSVFILSIGAFAIGLCEFISVGIISLVSNRFGVSTSDSSLIVSIYAMGVTIGAPLLTLFFVNVNKKVLLIASMLFFSFFNLLCGYSSEFSLLLLARFFAGMFHGLYFGIGATVATRLVPPDKASRAIAVMFLGLTLAIAFGVPISSFLAQTLGYENTYLFVSVIAGLAALGVLAVVPRSVSNEDKPLAMGEIVRSAYKILTSLPLMGGFLLTIAGWGASFTSYTFISPIFKEVGGFNDSSTNLLFLLYGLGVGVGNLYGGHFADRLGVRKSLIVSFLGIFVVNLLIFKFIHVHSVILLLTFFWGLFNFSVVPSLQNLVMRSASKYDSHVASVASSFNISAFNIGIMFFSYFGAYLITKISVEMTLVASSLIILITLFLFLVFGKKDGKNTSRS